MNKTLIFFLIASAILALVGCNTLDGIGEDLQNAGESMQEASD